MEIYSHGKSFFCPVLDLGVISLSLCPLIPVQAAGAGKARTFNSAPSVGAGRSYIQKCTPILYIDAFSAKISCAMLLNAKKAFPEKGP